MTVPPRGTTRRPGSWVTPNGSSSAGSGAVAGSSSPRRCSGCHAGIWDGRERVTRAAVPTATRPSCPLRRCAHLPPNPHASETTGFGMLGRGRPVPRSLPPPASPSRELPIHAGSNPCVGAPCRTADNRRGAACCRDLQVEIMCRRGQRRLGALVRARKSPYLCKVERETPESLNAEMISACAFLVEDGIHCALHGRRRPDGRAAKPDLCSQWPEGSDTMHPGCVFARG